MKEEKNYFFFTYSDRNNVLCRLQLHRLGRLVVVAFLLQIHSAVRLIFRYMNETTLGDVFIAVSKNFAVLFSDFIFNIRHKFSFRLLGLKERNVLRSHFEIGNENIIQLRMCILWIDTEPVITNTFCVHANVIESILPLTDDKQG